MPEGTADTIVFPIISRSSSPAEGVLPKAVANAFDAALGDITQPEPAFLDIDGMSGRRYRLFANTLARLVPDPRYLEVGVWAGSTLCSTIAGNFIRAVAVENWSQFGGPRERCLENLDRFGTGSEVLLIERDFRAVRYADCGRFNIYLFDGPHCAADQHDGLALALPALDREFVFIVDDWNWGEVRTGTQSAIEGLHLEVVFSIEVRTTTDDTHPPHSGFEAKMTDWHNGYFIGVLRKPAKPAARSLFGTALVSRWKRLAAKREASKSLSNAGRYSANPVKCEVLALITHYYDPERQRWLREVLKSLADLGAQRTHAVVITNSADSASLGDIRSTAALQTSNFSTEVVTPSPLLHPYYLPWAQKPLIAERFLSRGSRFTHVVSLEDDIAFGGEAFLYWLQYRPLLAANGVIPSFMRTEMRLGDPITYATDATAINLLAGRPSVRAGSFTFVALDNPYCAMFVLDRALAREYASSDSFDVGTSMWINPCRIRERAAMGLCFDNLPPGFPARHVVPVTEETLRVAQCCYVKHLPGNYANNPASPFGKLPASAVLVP